MISKYIFIFLSHSLSHTHFCLYLLLNLSNDKTNPIFLFCEIFVVSISSDWTIIYLLGKTNTKNQPKKKTTKLKMLNSLKKKLTTAVRKQSTIINKWIETNTHTYTCRKNSFFTLAVWRWVTRRRECTRCPLMISPFMYVVDKIVLNKTKFNQI